MNDKQYRKFLKRATEDKDVHLYIGETSDKRGQVNVDVYDEPDAHGNSKMSQALAAMMLNNPGVAQLVAQAMKVVQWHAEGKVRLTATKGGDA